MVKNKKPSIKNAEQRQEKVQNTVKGKSRTSPEWGEMEPRKLTLLTGVKPDTFSRVQLPMCGMNGPARH